MGMATPRPVLRWDEEHTAEVRMVWVVDDGGTAGTREVLGRAPSLTVCSKCRSGRTICRCDWRQPCH